MRERIIELRTELIGRGLDAGPLTIAWHLERQRLGVPGDQGVTQTGGQRGGCYGESGRYPGDVCVQGAECFGGGRPDLGGGALTPTAVPPSGRPFPGGPPPRPPWGPGGPPTSAGRIVRRAARRAGITKAVGPHTLRHAFITAALDAGVPLRDVQEAASPR